MIVYDQFKNLSIFTLGQRDRLEPLLRSDLDERLADLSPNGRWLAYESDESGKQMEIFIRPFPDVSGGREKVSQNGGRYPRWAPKGGELYYTDLDGRMMAVAIATSPTLTLGSVTKLFDGVKPPPGRSGVPYDVSPVDGRFLTTEPVTMASERPTQVSVVLNWRRELLRFAPR